MRGPLLTVLGGVLVGFGAWLVLAGADGSLAQPGATPSAFATSRPPPTGFVTASPAPGVRPIPDGYRIQIPRLRIDLPIQEGDVARDIDNEQTPEHAAFHLPRTGIPGEGSNSYIYAHARSGMFLSLWDAKVGDEVFISTPDGRALRYTVSEVHPRVPRTETKWVLPTPAERLTLQTSTGPNSEDPRFVVVAVPAT